MSIETMNPPTTTIDEARAVAALRAGDEAAFATLTDRYRRQLHVHSYRMLGSFDEAEDVVQETFLRAWKARETFEGRSRIGTWLHRIATNVALDTLDRRPRRPVPAGIGSATSGETEVLWLQPYPDVLLEQAAPSADEPETKVVSRETIELAFIVAIQHLPPRQRAVLIARDYLGWSARDTADLLETSPVSVNSALQRARATLKDRLPERRLPPAASLGQDVEERAILERYVDATERSDIAALASVLRDDVRSTMPPQPGVARGRDALVHCWASVMVGPKRIGDWRVLLTAANRQPAAACYLRAPGESIYRAKAIDVLRIEDGLVAEITTFGGPGLFERFGLPPTL